MTAENETPRPPDGYETWMDWLVGGTTQDHHARSELSALRARVAELEVHVRADADLLTGAVESRDTFLRRAESAEAEIARLREVLGRFAEMDKLQTEDWLCSDDVMNIARDALAPPPQADGGQ